jgi:hypothetical protein
MSAEVLDDELLVEATDMVVFSIGRNRTKDRQRAGDQL